MSAKVGLETGHRFDDRTPVTVTLKTDMGALRALIDNPCVLEPDKPGARWGNAVRRGVEHLRVARDEAGA